MARREKYTTHVKPYLKDISNWIRDGEPEYVIIEKLGTNHDSFNKYKKKYNELSEAIKKGEQNLLKHIETKLFERCKGYECEESKTLIDEVEDENGNKKKKKKIEKIKKVYAPDTTALIFALKNLGADKWKDRQEIQQDINAKLENITIDIEEDED
jgi:hypothetical protein